MKYSAVNIKEKLAKFSEHFSPKIIARMNDYHFKLGKFQGHFVWHKHTDTDEAFLSAGLFVIIKKLNLGGHL